MRLTVALCTYNPRQDLLLRVVDAIGAQTAGRSDVELLVVDNNSSPSLESEGYLDGHALKLIVETRQGLTAAREAAIAVATGEILLFVDDDNVLEAGYLDGVLAEFDADPELGLLGGAIEPEYEHEPPAWFAEFEPQLAIRRYAPDFRAEITGPPYVDEFPVGAGFAMRRKLAAAYVEDSHESGRIEGRRGTVLSSGEDLDLAFFALSEGRKLVVDGKLRLIHVIPPGRVEFDYMRRLMTGTVTSSLELEKKWSARLGQPIFPMFAVPRWRLALSTLAARVLALRSPRYRLKYSALRQLALARR